MPTLLLRLVGPMQSWGTTSRFDQRDTGKEPSKSGVIGLLAAAMGIDREIWTDLEPLTRLTMGVRHDRPGTPKYDYQTAGCAEPYTIIKADGNLSKDGVVSQRFYLADAAFLVGLEGADRTLLEKAYKHLKNPTWPLALGRKSYLPSEPIWIENGVQDAPVREVLEKWPWLGTPRRWEAAPEKLQLSLESADNSGLLRMDQPLASFVERQFGARYVQSEWIAFPAEVPNVSE
ncbi:MAG: type I-E CRISPR-associated protein Cas5/CasD [Syntrophales bacterium]